MSIFAGMAKRFRNWTGPRLTRPVAPRLLPASASGCEPRISGSNRASIAPNRIRSAKRKAVSVIGTPLTLVRVGGIEIFEAINFTAQFEQRVPIRDRRIVDHDHVVGRAADGDRAFSKFVSDFALRLSGENQFRHDVDLICSVMSSEVETSLNISNNSKRSLDFRSG